MVGLTARDFQLGIVRVVLFTDPDGFSSSAVMRSFFPAVSEFDGDPHTIGDEAVGLPAEVPRVLLRARSGVWHCQVAPSRIDVFWNRPDGRDTPTLSRVVDEGARVLKTYRSKVTTSVKRVAAVVTRYAGHEQGGLFLARHFCQERWHGQPLNRPESFELHAHKAYALKGFSVNSWFRAKTGKMTERGSESAIVLAEQDLNTLPREREFSDDEISAFFTVCAAEFDHILGLYFPSNHA
jgi:hypothetical protein